MPGLQANVPRRVLTPLRPTCGLADRHPVGVTAGRLVQAGGRARLARRALRGVVDANRAARGERQDEPRIISWARDTESPFRGIGNHRQMGLCWAEKAPPIGGSCRGTRTNTLLVRRPGRSSRPGMNGKPMSSSAVVLTCDFDFSLRRRPVVRPPATQP